MSKQGLGLGDAGKMADCAINTDALVTMVNTLADELEAVLALGPDPAAVARLNDLGDRLNDLGLALTYAEAAGRIVKYFQDRCDQRGGALAEVYGIDRDAVTYARTYSSKMLLREFGPRFAPPDDGGPTDEDIPF